MDDAKVLHNNHYYVEYFIINLIESSAYNWTSNMKFLFGVTLIFIILIECEGFGSNLFSADVSIDGKSHISKECEKALKKIYLRTQKMWCRLVRKIWLYLCEKWEKIWRLLQMRMG